MHKISALIAGILFGAGLTLAQMTNPQKVLAFLDITRQWDPSLALVMAAALAVSGFSYWLKRRMHQPLFEKKFHLSEASRIDKRLVTGAILFGIGWGLVGLCPGPALTSIAYPTLPGVTFVIAMLSGMFIAKRCF